MPNPNAMFLERPFSSREWRKVAGGSDPRRLAMQAPILPRDYTWEMHDFGAALDTAQWTVANAGVVPTDFAFNAQRGGALRGATGTTANNVIAAYKTQTILDAADNPLVVVRFKMPAAVSSFVFELALSDPKTSEVAVSVSDVDTPAIANGVTDAGILVMDTAQTLVTPALVGVGTSTAVAKTNITDRSAAVWTPTVSVWVEVLLGVRAGVTYATIHSDGAPVGQFSVASGPDAGVLMRPSFVFKTLNTTTKQIDIDYVAIGTERNAT